MPKHSVVPCFFCYTNVAAFHFLLLMSHVSNTRNWISINSLEDNIRVVSFVSEKFFWCTAKAGSRNQQLQVGEQKGEIQILWIYLFKSNYLLQNCSQLCQMCNSHYASEGWSDDICLHYSTDYCHFCHYRRLASPISLTLPVRKIQPDSSSLQQNENCRDNLCEKFRYCSNSSLGTVHRMQYRSLIIKNNKIKIKKNVVSHLRILQNTMSTISFEQLSRSACILHLWHRLNLSLSNHMGTVKAYHFQIIIPWF